MHKLELELLVFDEEDENPTWIMSEQEAKVFVGLQETFEWNDSDYGESDEFQDSMPVGYNGFNIKDEKGGISWILFGERVYRFNSGGVKKIFDEKCELESFLRSCIKDKILQALATPTRPS